MGYLSIEKEGVSKAYGYMPNLPVNVVACVLFFLVLAVQLSFGAYTRDWWMFVTWGITAALEVAGYAARALSHKYTQSLHLYEMQSTCLVFAPAFMSAGLYYQLAKEITVFGKKYSPLRPMTYTAICTTCDVLALLIQGGGGGVAAAGIKSNRADVGGAIMLSGIVFQLASLVAFIALFAYVSWKIFTDQSHWDPQFATNRQRPLFKYWLPAVSLSIIFLLVRSIYRVVELSDGWSGYIARTERYFLVMDGLMILLSMLPLCFVYPALAYGEVPVEGVHYKKGQAPSSANRASLDSKENGIDLAVNYGVGADNVDEGLAPSLDRRAKLYSDTRGMLANEV